MEIYCLRENTVTCKNPQEFKGRKCGTGPLIDVHTSTHGSKAQKRLSMRNVNTSSNHTLVVKYYNFLIFNATSQKAHHARKKA